MKNGKSDRELLYEILDRLTDQDLRLTKIEGELAGTKRASVVFGGIGLLAGVVYAVLTHV